jgi:hypothetical protein
MGIIDFVANAGAKLFGKDEEAAAAAPTPTIDVNKVRAVALTRLVKDSKLPVQDLAITVNGDRAPPCAARCRIRRRARRSCSAAANAATIASVDDQLTVAQEAAAAKEAPSQFYIRRGR